MLKSMSILKNKKTATNKDVKIKVKIHKNSNLKKQIINIVQILSIVLALAILFLFTHSNLTLLYETDNVDDYQASQVKNYFDKTTINTLIEIDKKKASVKANREKLEGRTNSFYY